MMKKVYIILICLVGLSTVVVGQQDPQMTHFMDDRLSINPGSAGMKDFCFTLMHRKQWIDFPGQPTTTLLNVQSPVRVLHGGVGLSYYYDKLGFVTNNLIRLSYSYHVNVGLTGKLGVGASVGAINKIQKADWRPPSDQHDNSITEDNANATTYDLVAGLYYYIPGKMYVGLSSTRLTEPDLKGMNYEATRHYFLMAGYELPINRFAVRAGLLGKYANSAQLDVNLTGVYDNTIMLGASYRLGDAVAPMIGFQMPVNNGMLKFSIAYDYPISKMGDVTPGTYEAMLSYCFAPKSGKDSDRVKNVRFL